MYTIADYDLKSIGRSGLGSILCKVEGFWSSDTIRLYIHRAYAGNGWTFSISNSSGGRDSKLIEDDLLAYKRYAAALEAMCDLGVELRLSVDKLENWHMERRAEERKVREAQEAATKAAFDADNPLGRVRAITLVEDMTEKRTHIRAFKRGEDRPFLVEVACREKTKYYFGGSIIAKKALIEKLAEFSVRSVCYTA